MELSATIASGGVFALLLSLHILGYIYARRSKGVIATKPQLAAHAVGSLVGFSMLASLGTMYWVFYPDMALAAERLSRTRSSTPGSIQVTFCMCGFQMYELFCALFLEPSLRGRNNEMLAHHIMAFTLSVLGMTYSYAYYYSPFFMGIIELSSVPLVTVDFFKDFKQLRPKYPLINEVGRTAFAILFVFFRILYWPIVTLQFWQDSMHELSDIAAGDSAIPLGCVLTFLVSNLLLTAMQAYWGSLVVKALAQKLLGDESHKDA